MEPSPLESLFGESGDIPLTVGKRDLERAFRSILEQLASQRRASNPWSETEGRRNCDESCQYATRKCCCDRNEAPSFSLAFSNPRCCSANGVGHGSSCRTAGHNKVLQIHLPESSKDPCQILITSCRDQVSVKYLQQGQQFTFSTNGTPISQEVDDQLFSNAESDSRTSGRNANANRARETACFQNEGLGSTHSSGLNLQNNYNPNIQNTNPLGIVIQDVMSQRQDESIVQSNNVSMKKSLGESERLATQLGGRSSSEEDTVEKLHDNGVVLSLNEPNVSDGSFLDIPPSKRQKKQSLDTFIDSLLDKRAREASQKNSNERDGTIGYTKVQENSLETHEETFSRTMDDDLSSKRADTGKVRDSRLSSEVLKETATVPILAQAISDPSPLVKDSSPIATVMPSITLSAAENKSPMKKGRFKCQYCNELFQQRSQCLLHISQRHVEERPHHCPLCDATFKKRRSLKYHIRHHNGERPFKCTYCDKAFKEKYHLTVHIRTHTGERPFACTQCGKAFKQTNELTSHIRTHTGERPYKCNLCDRWFKRRSQLYNHNISHLPDHALESVTSNNEMDSI